MATIVHNEDHARNASDFHMVQDIHDTGADNGQQANSAYGAQSLPGSTVQSLPGNGYGQAQALPASTSAHPLPAGHTVPHGIYGAQALPGSVPAQAAVAPPAHHSTATPVTMTHTPVASTPVAATHAAPIAATQTTTRPAVTTTTTQPAVHLPVTMVKAKDTSYGRAKPAKTTYVAPGTTGVATTTAKPATNASIYTTGQPGVVSSTAPVATTTTVKPKKKGCCASQPAVEA